MSGDAFRKYAAGLARVANNLEPMAARRTAKVAKGAAATARQLAPTETGALASGISVVRRPDGSMSVETADSTYWGHFQEYGTTKMAPNPFMGPAVDRWEPRLFTELEGLVDDIAREL